MKNKLKIYFFIAVSLFMFLATANRAEAQVQEVSQAGGDTLWIGEGLALNVTPCIGDQYIKGTAFTQNQANCITELIKNLNIDTQKTIQAYMKKRLREEWWDQMKTKAREAMAGAFKKSLENMARQIGKDTAVWVASGGRGQKPLFITEGWGAYVKNAADVALGDFIDQVGQSFNVDLCEPDFNVKLAILVGIDDRQTKRVRCSFSEIMSNWESAISNANFSVDYRAALRPGENDISVALMLADKKNSYIAGAVEAAGKEAEIPGLWTDIKDIAGKILTPGSMIHDKFQSDIHDTSKLGWETFTDTIWDLLGSFLDTLVGQLAVNLKNGFFSGDSSGDSDDGVNLPDLSSLFTPWSSPVVAGVKGAEDKFGSLKSSAVKIGGQYDLLNKLSTCQDPNNPGPMECVLDVGLASAIRQEVLVKDLPNEVLDRPFVPLANKVESPNQYFSVRGVTILRKYRIVPVGWEYAAKIISDLANDDPTFKGPTLREIMDKFGDNSPTNPYFGLIDPFWVMKAPEMFCRREGYGPQNSFSDDQAGAVYRNTYCADEQQCIKESENGSCMAYGYCSEERRVWDFGKSCDEKFNTCNTYVNRDGQTNYWLTNTLDFRNCDQSVVGCRWFSTEYNPVSQYWAGSNESNFYQVNNTAGVQAVTLSSDVLWRVQESQYVSGNKRLIMYSPCSEILCKDPAMNGTCSFVTSTVGNFCQFDSSLSCNILVGGINCRLPICSSTTDAFASGNGGFENQEGIYTDNAQHWSDEMSFITINNRAYREGDGGKSGAGLRVLSNGTPSAIVLASDAFAVESGSSYHLKFDIRGSIGNQGRLIIFVYGGDKKITSNDLSDVKILSSIEIGDKYETDIWQAFRSSEFKVQDFSTATIAIMAPQGTFADIRLDNFSLNRVDSKCFENSVTVFSQTQTETATTSKDIYFDRDAQVCSPASSGCSQFLRLKGGVGTNLIYNGGFEYDNSGWSDYWGGSAGPIDSISDGKARLKYSDQTYSTYWPIKVEPGSYYAVSFDASQIATSNNVKARFEMVFVEQEGYADNVALHREVFDFETNCSQGGENTLNLIFAPSSTGMERKSCWFRVPTGAKIMMFKPFADTSGGVVGSNVYFDNLKIEKVTYPALISTPYAPYDPGEAQSKQVTYLKKAPDYFNCYYYKEAVTPRWPTTPQELDSVLAGRSLACSQFAGVCLPSEVGCELYKPLNGDPTVPGVANDIDACPQECAGYQVYKQESTRFVNDKYRQFIADKKAKYCSASYAGCDEFTNLDELGRGAEAKEYYSAIRACQKPDVDDGAYYTWEGSDTAGYQLKAYNLKKSTSTDPGPTGPSGTALGGIAPCTNLSYDSEGKPRCYDPEDWPDTQEDRLEAGFCTVNDLVTNADCRQFYDVSGNVHYRLLSKTVTVSNNCHPYRRTMTQNSIVEAQEDCASHRGWWKEAEKECIYMAIPGEGMRCPASAKGCRAYTGNRGNNVRNVIEVANFGLQSSTTGRWVGADGTASGLFVSSESTFPGGNSLMNSNTVTIKHPVEIKRGKTYVLSFWAKGSAPFNMESIKFSGANDTTNYFAVKQIQGDNLLSSRPTFTPDWNLYELGPVFVDWDPSGTEHLEFNLPSVDYKIYLDNVILKEVVNKVYIVENSWYTPVSCDNTLDDPDGAKGRASGVCQDSASGRCSIGEMLGCAGYTTRSQEKVYLRSFASLCRPEAAGCEALIDTKNNATPLAKSYHAGDASEVQVPADEQIYMVNASAFSCPGSDKGCTPYGLPFVDQQDNTVGYQSIFIKNQPDRYETDLCNANNIWCEEFAGNGGARYFKEPHNKICVYGVTATSTAASWYKFGTKGDPCDVTLNQTYGTGYGSVGKKQQPVGVVSGATYSSVSESAYSGWVGACPQAQSSCTEFVDPLTEMYVGERGKVFGNSVSYVLKANILYSISSGNGSRIEITSSNCNFIPQEVTYPAGAVNRSGYLYYAKSNAANTFCNATITPTILGSKFKVAKAGVYYKLASSVNKSGCNGLVDFGTGCVLFNDRSGVDYSTTTMAGRNRYLNFDAQYTFIAQNYPISPQAVGPKTAQEASNAGKSQNGSNADVILKVKPDRTCSNWLSCTSYIKGDGDSSNEKFGEKDYCLGVSACDDLSDDNQCSHLAPNNSEILDLHNTDNRLSYLNKTGYSVPGLYPVDQMDYWGQGANVGNGNFEFLLASGKPLGWNPVEVNKSWDPSLFSVISDSKTAPEGKNYLRVNFINPVISEAIDVVPGMEYYVSFWVNTENLKNSDGDTYGAYTILYVQNSKDVNSYELNDAGRAAGILNQDGVGAQGKGIGWTRKQFSFTPTTTQVYIKIRNRTSAFIKSVGYTLWDDIQISPVLNNSVSSSTVSKTCRTYPSSDSPSCKYTSGSTNYYGWYGYCLTPDPTRRSDCLQWFPVDKIKGELSSDYALGYDNRSPLYYCVDWDIVSVDISGGGLLGNIGENIGSDWSEKISSVITDNRNVTTVAFDVNPEYAGFMKYPYINRFIFTGGFGGVTEAKTQVYVLMNAYMYPNCARGIVSFIPFFFGNCDNDPEDDTLSEPPSLDLQKKQDIFDSCLKNHFVNGVNGESYWIDKFCKYYSVGDSGQAGGFCVENLDTENEECPTPQQEADRYYGEVKGSPDNYNAWNSTPNTVYKYKCLDPEQVANWKDYAGNKDMDMEVSDFCDGPGDNFCRASNTQGGILNTAGYDGCKADCPVKLDAIDDDIEECIKDKVSELNDNSSVTNRVGEIVWGFLTDTINSIGGFFWDLEKDPWGGWGAVGFTVDGLGLTPIVFAVPWNWAMRAPSTITTITAIVNVIIGLFGGDALDSLVLGFGVSGVKIITDEDPDYGSSITDPDPDVPGNVLGYAWLLNTSQMYGAGLLGSFSGYMNVPYCKAFVKTVESSGQNRAYYSKVGLGSSHNYYLYAQTYDGVSVNEVVTTTPLEEFSYEMDYMPFGALVPPSTGDIDAPITWDSKTLTSINRASINLPGVEVSGLELIEPKVIGLNFSSSKQPLFFEAPVMRYGAPYQARAGGGVRETDAGFFAKSFRKIGVYLNSKETLRTLFAKNYGGVFKWKWNDVKRYDPNWSVLGDVVATVFDGGQDQYDCISGGNICEPKTGSNGGRYEEDLNDTLGFSWDDVEQLGKGIKIKNSSGSILSKYDNISLVKLTFNTEADVDQLPLKSYTISWGDGEVDTVSGVSLNDKPNVTSTFTVYHTYDYNKMRDALSITGTTDMHCCYDASATGGQNCAVLPWPIVNKPESCNDSVCTAKIFISVRDSWDKVNYCNAVTQSSNADNVNFRIVNISSN